MVEKLNKNLLVVNLFAGPGAGKSTNAAGIFYQLKQYLYNVELVTEFAKEKVYDGYLGCLEDQLYVFAKQQRRLKRLVGHVDIAVTDSPLLLSILYNKDQSLTFTKLVKETFDSYTNLNFYINRVKPYVKIGRTQDECEAIDLDKKLIPILDSCEVKFEPVFGDSNCANYIAHQVKDYFTRKWLKLALTGKEE